MQRFLQIIIITLCFVQFSAKAESQMQPWRAPEFEDQTSALGWSPEVFKTPAGLEHRVHFWVDVYSKYTTHQGIIHDVDDLSKIYEIVDFNDIDQSELPPILAERMRQKKVDEAKKRIARTNASVDIDQLRYQLGQKDRMESAIISSGRYIEDFEHIFRTAGLPIELTRLVFVESSFNVMARSKVGASGLWQLMPGTVRPYGLISPAVDGRNHPITATRMAARILAANYRKLGSWPLALTAYNHGASGVARLVEKEGTKDLAVLVKYDAKKTFGFASKNFYASFLAAYEVEKNAPKYFPGIAWAKPFEGEPLRLSRPLVYRDILSWFEGNDRLLEMMNPHLTWRVRHGRAIPQGTQLLIPASKFDLALLKLGRRAREVANAVTPKSSAPSHLRSASAPKANYLAK